MKSLIKSILIMLLLTVGVSQSYAEQKITFYHYDLLGSPVATTDENGAVIWREEYGPWGEKLLKEDEALDNVRGYTGHVNDKETGLTYMQARYYDPQIGRFMGVDPVGFQENNTISFNRYGYANNNPYKFTDPNGKIPLICSFCGVNPLDRAITTADVLADNVPVIGNAKSAYEIKTGVNPITREQIPDSARAIGAIGMVVPWAKNLKHLKHLKGVNTKTKLGTIKTRTTKNNTRLGGLPGEPGVKITYKDGTEFDMTRSRVKETELNPYKPDRTRHKRFDDALDSKGTKRAPTKDESDWFDGIDF